MCLTPNLLSAFLAICFPYDHSPVAITERFPGRSPSSALLLHFSFLPAIYSILLLYSLQHYSLPQAKAAHTVVFLLVQGCVSACRSVGYQEWKGKHFTMHIMCFANLQRKTIQKCLAIYQNLL